MKGRTYRYMTEEPLFPFGYGLSYTQFNVGLAQLSAKEISAANGKLTVTVPVTNTGRRAGTEVVQLYIHRTADAQGPRKSLRGYARVSLRPGETRNVEIQLDTESFECFDETTNTMRTLPGQYEVFYGTSSADRDLKCLDVTLK